MKPLYTLEGIVQQGQGRGKRLGFPTINFNLNQKVPEGIYASKILINRAIYKAVTFIGPVATYHETEVKVETYVFDFSASVHGSKVSLDLLKMLRDNKNFFFSSEEALIEQMEKDKRMAEEFFSSN